MGATWQGTIVLIGILVFTSYVIWSAVADGREAQRLADLGSCGLAHAYADWRVGFGEAPCTAADADRAGCEAFMERSRAFEYASRLAAAEPAPPAQATLVDRLRALAVQDADRSNPIAASTDAFMVAFAGACPMEYAVHVAQVVE